MSDQIIDTGLRIAYLGPPCDHRDNLLSMLQDTYSPITILDDSICADCCAKQPSASQAGRFVSLATSRLSRFVSQFQGTTNEDYLRYITKRIDDEKIDCVIAYWGTRPLADLIAIKRLRPQVKTILNVLCHPLGLSAQKIAMQNWQFRHAVGSCDGLIASSQHMLDYLRKNVYRGREIPTIIWPPYLMSSYFPKQRMPQNENTPNILFMGRTDWKSGQPTDDVTRVLEQLLDCGVHVFHASSEESTFKHPCAHAFKYLPLDRIGTFATQFDAALVTYNLDRAQRSDRFEVTVPDRLVISVAAGIPIAIPSTGYTACKEYLQDYGGVIEFDSALDLSQKLADRSRLAQQKSAALANSMRYTAENHKNKLLELISKLNNLPAV